MPCGSQQFSTGSCARPAAFALATALLRPGGAFVVKVFDGSDAPAFTRALQARFASVRRMKPKAVRPESVEFYLVATGFKGEEKR